MSLNCYLSMRRINKIIGSLGLLAVVFLAGCATQPRNATVDNGRRDINVFGIVKSEPRSYAPNPAHTFVLSSDEVLSTNQYSGDRVSFLWGLVTLTDY